MKRPRSCSSTLLSLTAPALALLLSCSATTEPPSGDPRIDLRSGDPRIRILGARGAAEAGRQDLLEDLSQALSDPDPAVRMFADIALRKITSQDFDFKPHGTIAEREAVRAKWLEWISSQRSSGEKDRSQQSPADEPSTARKEEPQDASVRKS